MKLSIENLVYGAIDGTVSGAIDGTVRTFAVVAGVVGAP